MKHYARLSAFEREEISRGLAAGQSLRKITARLPASTKTVQGNEGEGLEEAPTVPG